MEQFLPSNINYLDNLPKAIPSERKRRRYYPTGGNAAYIPGNEIRINVESPRAFLDPNNCYLTFTFLNSTGQTLGFDLGGAYSLFKTFRIHQGGNEITRIANFNRLMNAVIIPATGGINGRAETSLIGFGRYGNVGTAGNINTAAPNVGLDGADVTASGSNDDGQIAAGASIKFSMPMVGGLFSCNKLLPLPLLNKPIELIFEIDPDRFNPFVTPAAGADYEIQDVSLVADLVEVPRDVLGFMKELQMAHGGSLVLQGHSYEYNADNVEAGFVGTKIINVPSRKRSIKSLFFVGASSNYAGIGGGGVGDFNTYNLSFGGNMNLNSYFIRAGAMVMPQPAIRAQGDAAAAGVYNPFETQRGESYTELKKAIGHMGKHMGTGILSAITYATTDCDNADGAAMQQSPVEDGVYKVCPFGIDLEAYQNEAVRAGLDTQSLSLDMQLNLDIGTAGGGAAEDFNVDVFTLYDVQYYINMDGSITFED